MKQDTKQKAIRLMRPMQVLMMIALFFSASSAPAQIPAPGDGSRVPVVVRSFVTVIDDRIFLKDIVESPLFKETENVSLMDAPAPGREKMVPGSWFASVLQSQRWMPEGAAVRAPDYVRITRAHQVLSEARLKSFTETQIADHFGDSDFTIREFNMRGSEAFPVGKIALQVSEPMPRDWTGRVTLRTRVKVDGRQTGWVYLSCWVDRYRDVVCTDRYLPRNTILTASDLKLERINVSRTPANLVHDLEVVVGKQIRRSLKSGEFLRYNMLAVPPLVQKGDRVKLIAQQGALRVVTYGIAKGSGGKGDQIKIENVASKRMIVGRIQDASTVEVLF